MNGTGRDGGRLLSLDLFRGATVAAMILVNNPGSWQHVYPPLLHAGWHGCTPTDLVFPFFLFAVGCSLALVLPGLRAAGGAVAAARVARRVAIIFALGLTLNAAPFLRWDAAGDLVWRDWETLRIMGVLQRIALTFGAAAAIVWWTPRRAVPWVAALLLAGYWAAGLAWGDPADPWSLTGWFGNAVDHALLGAGHLYRGEGVAFDPEGLASTPPAVAQVLLGWCVGDALRRAEWGPALVARLFVAAAALLAAGNAWQLGMPVNKKIWTSSYVLVSTGLAIAALALLMHRFEAGAAAGRAPPRGPGGFATAAAAALGRNALFVFVLSGLLPRLLGLLRWRTPGPDGAPAWTTPLPWLYETVFAGVGGDPRVGSLLFALAQVAAYTALALWMARRGIAVRV